MSPKRQRMRFVLGSIVVMALAATAMVYSFRDDMVFFYTPSQFHAKQSQGLLGGSHDVRIGGLVKNHSVVNLKTGGIAFTITDLTAEMKVTYHGLLPMLFREGQGVVAQGVVDGKGTLEAETILAKHDENYMPREVVAALKKSGKWKGGAQ